MNKYAPILEGEKLAIGYPKGKNIHWVARDMSFSLRTEQLACLLGPNGVGKSTLVKAIMGQRLAMEGKLLFEGQPLQKLSTQKMAKKVSVVLTDRISPGNMTVKQLVGLGRIPFTNWLGNLSEEDEKAVEEAIDATHIRYLQTKKVSELSDGQLQKTMIARALAQDGELMVLDEPTAHLDLVNRMEIMQLLREIAHSRNKAILVVTHDLDIAVEAADEFWLMTCGGALTTGSPEDLILSGSINQLLPEGKFYYSPSTGKITSYAAQAQLPIDGPREVVQWLELALRKRQIKLAEHLQITALADPIAFVVDKAGIRTKVNTIQEVLRELGCQR